MGSLCSKKIQWGNIRVANYTNEQEPLEQQCRGMEHTFHLYHAISENKFEEARHLISNGTDVNCLNYIGGTPLIETCRVQACKGKQSRRDSFVRFLIQNGANTNQTDIYGWNALSYAEKSRLGSVTDILEECGSIKIITDNAGGKEMVSDDQLCSSSLHF